MRACTLTKKRSLGSRAPLIIITEMASSLALLLLSCLSLAAANSVSTGANATTSAQQQPAAPASTSTTTSTGTAPSSTLSQYLTTTPVPSSSSSETIAPSKTESSSSSPVLAPTPGRSCICPVACSCVRNIVNCSSSNLDAIPLEFLICSSWSNVEILDLNGNDLGVIRAASFEKFPNLNRLFLYNNHIYEIENDAFIGLSSLELLSLDGNQLTTLPPNVFQPLRNLQRLLLYTNQLVHLPHNLLNNLERLRILALHENKITQLDPEFFDAVPQLTSLYLHENQIATLLNSPFRSLGRLRTLYLRSNQIQALTPASLAGLESLNVLLLSENDILHIDDGSFSNCTKLQSLYLGSNSIQRVTLYTFADLTNLKVLRLGNNLINFIQGGSFARLSLLTILSLYNNQIDNISPEILNGLFSLTEILLYNNGLVSLQADLFINTPSLVRLWLQNNRIRCIDVNALRGLLGLQILQLSGNEILELPDGTFQHTPNLRYLLLASNKLTRISSNLLNNLPILIQLTLYYNAISSIAEGALNGTTNIFYFQWNAVLNYTADNRLDCECDVEWLKDYLITYDTYSDTIYCAGPGDLANVKLRTAPINETQCSIEVTILPNNTDSISVGEGDCLQLQCKTNRPGAVVTWARQDGPLRSSAHELCGNLPVNECGMTDTSGLLTISDFSSQDEGYYRCSTTYKGRVVFDTKQLIFGEPAEITQLPVDQTYRDPPPYVMFDVGMRGSPKPSIRWLHNNQEINSSYNNRCHMTTDGDLIILRPEKSDSGEYTVVVSNDQGFASAVAQLQIYFPSPCGYGEGCSDKGTCIPYYECQCQEGFEGFRCESETDGVAEQPEPIEDYNDHYGSRDYYYGSGDYYYGSGDYYYGSGDYYYGSGDYYYYGSGYYDYQYGKKRSAPRELKKSRLRNRHTNYLKRHSSEYQMMNEITNNDESVGGVQVAEADDKAIPYNMNMMDGSPPLPAMKDMKKNVEQ